MLITGTRIRITGVVQGVGFRPFVFGLATRCDLKGWVQNTSRGVEIEINGTESATQNFIRLLAEDAPPLAAIDSFETESCSPNGFSSFKILRSRSSENESQPISPDVGVCPDCLRELFDPDDPRYLYPFISCTNCGPRFTIIKDIPYDRPATTMASFAMCDFCREEYEDPSNRRFHAQPVACPECGPQIWLETGRHPWEAPPTASYTAISKTQDLLRSGRIVAIKGLGGFHLACDATNSDAVDELRRRKLRRDKPFAVMMPDINTVSENCYITFEERAALESPQRPIVILNRKENTPIVSGVAPRQQTIGVMLPYTPLHYLLFHQPLPHGEKLTALVMTSGNLSEEPIAHKNEDARERLSALADAFLIHDRDIHIRCDDSVLRCQVSGKINKSSSLSILRRSRGYAPFPIKLPFNSPHILATGSELKNTFCLTKEQYAFISHHIGDLENYETLQSFEQGIEHFERLFRVNPAAIAYDLHPNYLATRYALERAEKESLPAIGVQHHHAHIAACMADNGLNGDRPVIGAVFDGTGYGEDGNIWGGEFMIADYRGYERFAHLRYVPLPGGDKAIKEPWRIALAWLYECGIPWNESLPPIQAAPRISASAVSTLRKQLDGNINTPLTSSIGRLFDAVSSLCGIRQIVNYEAQAAIELEALADPNETSAYTILFIDDVLDPKPMFEEIIRDIKNKVPVSKISTRFHRGLAIASLKIILAMRKITGINEAALSGGVWQNDLLLKLMLEYLEENGFTPLLHHQIPANDGGISLGQAVIAGYLINGQASHSTPIPVNSKIVSAVNFAVEK